jgi:hypothetical protein
LSLSDFSVATEDRKGKKTGDQKTRSIVEVKILLAFWPPVIVPLDLLFEIRESDPRGS